MKRTGLSRHVAGFAAATVLLLSVESATAEGLKAQHATYILSVASNSGGNSITGAEIGLFEPGNRTSAIAEKTVSIAPFQQLQLDTIFNAVGLDADDRRKDRTNVEVVVTAVAGNARVAAMAVSIDNATGDTKTYPLAPIIGSGPPSITRAIAITPPTPATPPRKSAVRP